MYLGKIAPIEDLNNVTVLCDIDRSRHFEAIKKEVAFYQSCGLRVIEIHLNPFYSELRLGVGLKYIATWIVTEGKWWNSYRISYGQSYPVRAVSTVDTFAIVVEERHDRPEPETSWGEVIR